MTRTACAEACANETLRGFDARDFPGDGGNVGEVGEAVGVDIELAVAAEEFIEGVSSEEFVFDSDFLLVNDNRFFPFRDGDDGGDLEGGLSGVDALSVPSEMDGKFDGKEAREGDCGLWVAVTSDAEVAEYRTCGAQTDVGNVQSRCTNATEGKLTNLHSITIFVPMLMAIYRASPPVGKSTKQIREVMHETKKLKIPTTPRQTHKTQVSPPHARVTKHESREGASKRPHHPYT